VETIRNPRREDAGAHPSRADTHILGPNEPYRRTSIREVKALGAELGSDICSYTGGPGHESTDHACHMEYVLAATLDAL
jgi:hypothetical protein